MIHAIKIKLAIGMILMGGLSIQSCVSDDDYSTPCQGDCGQSVDWKVNTTIEEIIQKAEQTPLLIQENLVFEAYVISSDEAGNFYGSISLQDEATNPNRGIQIEIDKAKLFNDFPIGSKVKVNLNGIYLGEDRGVVKIGGIYTDNAGNKRVGRMPMIKIKTHLVKLNTPLVPIVPLEFEGLMQALKPENINKLITIQNVQFEESELGKTYADKEDKAKSVNRMIQDSFGKQVYIRNSGYTKFAANKVAEGSGSITAVLSRYNTDYQLYIRDITDVDMSKDRFDFGTEPEKPVGDSYLAFLGSDFSNWESFTLGLNGKLPAYATQSINGGQEGRNALHIETDNITANEFVFVAKPTANMPEKYTKIFFYMKGETTAKSISINLYNKEGKAYYFNLKDVEKSKKISASTSNQYVGSIDTKGEWVLIELVLNGITDLVSDTSKSLFGMKIGKDSAYDIYIDNGISFKVHFYWKT